MCWESYSACWLSGGGFSGHEICQTLYYRGHRGHRRGPGDRIPPGNVAAAGRKSDSGVADDSGPGGSRYDCTVRFHKKEEKIKEKKVSGENAPEAFSFSGIPGEIVKIFA